MLKHTSNRQIRLLSAVLVLALSMIACGLSKPATASIVGKWEVVSGNGIGTLYEFFQDGTVDYSGFAGTYSWPDQTHIKIDMGGMGLVYEYSLTSDQLSLSNSSTSTYLVLKKYQEFSPSAQVIAGTFERSYPDDSGCFLGLGISMTPQEIVFGTDGTFGLSDNVNLGITGSGLTMTGQFTINGKNVHVTAAGTQSSSGFLGVGASQSQVQGEFDCTVTISNSRLTFTDTQGQSTLFLRAAGQ